MDNPQGQIGTPCLILPGTTKCVTFAQPVPALDPLALALLTTAIVASVCRKLRYGRF